MKPRGVLHLYRIRLRARFVQESLAAVGIAVGVALLFASQVASTSLNGSVHQLTSGLVGQARLQLVARTPNGFDEHLLTAVQRIAGVRATVPVLEAQANVIGPNGRRSVELIGADPRTVHLGGSLLRDFSAAALARQHALALPAPVADQIGARSLEPIRLQLGAATTQALLGIVLQKSDIGALIHSPVALAPLTYAQQLAGMRDRLTRILIQPSSGKTAGVRTELTKLAGDRINVEPADFDAKLFDSAATPTNQSTAVFAAISALVGFLFAFNAILLTVPARRRLITDLRLDGYDDWTVVEILLVDALFLGTVACLLGLLLGDALSIHLFRASPGYLSFAFAIGSQRIVTWQSIAIAVVGGMLAAGIGVSMPMWTTLSRTSRNASSARPRIRRGHWMTYGGLACLAVTTGILLFSPSAVLVGIVTLTSALFLLLPVLLRGVIALTAHVTFDIRAKAPSVAVAALRSTWARTVAIAATGAIAVFGSVAVQGAHSDLQRGLDRSAMDVSAAASVWAFPPGLNNLLATEPFDPRAQAVLQRLPGVRSVSLYRGGFLDFADRRVWVTAPPRSQYALIPPHQLVQGNLAFADARVRAGGWAVVSKAIADEHHLRIGQSFRLPSPHPITLRVAAFGTNIGWPPGAIVISAADYASAWGSADASAFQIALAKGASADQVRDEVQQALGPSSGLTVQTATERERRQRTASRQGLSRLSQISTLILIAAILAMAAAMGNMLWLRRARLADLKLDGFSDLALWRALLLESVLLVGSGCFIGAVFGLYGQLLGSRAILGVTGFPVVFSLGLTKAVSSFAIVTAVAVAITAVPGYLIARVSPSSSD